MTSAGVDLISDALLFGRLWYREPDAMNNAVGHAKFFSRSHDAVIRVYDEAGNVIDMHTSRMISRVVARLSPFRLTAFNLNNGTIPACKSVPIKHFSIGKPLCGIVPPGVFPLPPSGSAAVLSREDDLESAKLTTCGNSSDSRGERIIPINFPCALRLHGYPLVHRI